MIEKGKIIELKDNSEYYIIDKIDLREKCYLYISRLEPTNGNDLFFVELKNNRIYKISDENIISELHLIVSEKYKND